MPAEHPMTITLQKCGHISCLHNGDQLVQFNLAACYPGTIRTQTKVVKAKATLVHRRLKPVGQSVAAPWW